MRQRDGQKERWKKKRKGNIERRMKEGGRRFVNKRQI